MGSFKINESYVENLLARIEAAFSGEVGARVVDEMRSRTPASERRQLKGKRRGETRRQVYMSFARGESNDPRSYFGGGRTWKRFETDPETQAMLAEQLTFHMKQEKGRKRSQSSIGDSRKADVFHGLKSAMFEPAASSTRGMSAAQSRSIRTGSFMRRGNLRISDGKMFAVFRPPSDKTGRETLRNSISILDVRREGRTVTLQVGNDPDEAPYGIYVEFGAHPHKGMKKQPFARQTLDSLADEITSGSLLRDVLKG